MELSGSYSFAAPASRVWDLLVDPEAVASCLPGCDHLEPLGGDRYRAELTMAVAMVSGKYSGTVAILDKEPPRSFRIVVEGNGQAGFVKGEARVELAAHGDTTTVNLSGEGQVGGLLARVGQRLLGAASKLLLDQFFACFDKTIKKAPG